MSLRGGAKRRRSNPDRIFINSRGLLRFARNDKRKRIGIFGGTFNPIHIGHIKMAEAARKEYNLSYVYFIPCGIPPHKPKGKLFPRELRYKLVREAIRGKKYFKVLDIEIKKKKPCYTIDTILSLRGALATKQSYKSNIGQVRLLRAKALAMTKSSRLYFLIGQDEFEKLHTWDKASQLAKLITFLVLPRVGARPMCLPKVKNIKWYLVHTKPINISSTKIRKNLNLSF